MFPINPLIAEQGEDQPIGFKDGAMIGDGLAFNLHFVIVDQLSAPFARAYALRLQYAVQGYFAHGGTLAECICRCGGAAISLQVENFPSCVTVAGKEKTISQKTNRHPPLLKRRMPTKSQILASSLYEDYKVTALISS